MGVLLQMSTGLLAVWAWMVGYLLAAASQAEVVAYLLAAASQAEVVGICGWQLCACA